MSPFILAGIVTYVAWLGHGLGVLAGLAIARQLGWADPFPTTDIDRST